MSTITKTRIADKPMAAFFAKKRGEKFEMVDAWIVEGRTTAMQRPYEIETRDYDRALEYARLIDADDEAAIEKLLNS
jgi:hypothetical protein